MKKKIVVFTLVFGMLTALALAARKPINSEGRPGFPALKPANFMVWHDDVGWHVRWVTTGKSYLFSGEIRSKDGVMEQFNVIFPQLDNLRYKNSARRISFKATNEKGQNGFDFKSSARKLKFNLKINGKGCSECIFIGYQAQHPASSSFSLESAPKKQHVPKDK